MPRACSFQRHLFPISTPEKVAWGYRGGGGVGGMGVGEMFQLSRSTHLGGSPLSLQLTEKGRAGDGDSGGWRQRATRGAS